MKNNKMEVIAIDPDNKMSGVAAVNTETGEIHVDNMTFTELVEYLTEKKRKAAEPDGTLFRVVIEAGWLNESNWHLMGRYMSAAKAAAIGRSVGMNHQTGILIEEICRQLLKLPTELQRPFKKCWKGKDGKITQAEITAIINHKLPRMNQDARDALLIAWVHANDPRTTRNNN